MTTPLTTPVTTSRVKGVALAAAALALLAVVLMPAPAGLSVAGQRVLAVLAFAIVVWITEAVSYPVSAGLVVSLGALLLGAAPPFAPGAAAATGARIGTG